MINNIKNKIDDIREWAEKRPKQIYIGGMIILFLCFSISLIKDIFFPSENLLVKTYGQSSSMLEATKMKNQQLQHKNTAKMEKIVKELEVYQKKYQEQGLDKTDSVRVEYLYNEYIQLKNER